MSRFVETGLNIEKLPLLESLLSIGNGYLGVRGYLEEFHYPGSVRGNYINGIYERIPMEHAEWAHGFPTRTDRMPNLIDLFQIRILLDKEEVILRGDIRDFKRELDFKEGLGRRSYSYFTKKGKKARISFESLVSFYKPQLRSWSLAISYDGEIEVLNKISFTISNMVSKEDPRIAPTAISLVKVEDLAYESDRGRISLETINSAITIGLDFKDEGNFSSRSRLDDKSLEIAFYSRGKLEINRVVKYQDSIRKNKTKFISKELLYKKQEEYLRDYNNRCRIDFLDNKELDTAMKFMRFHLLQSTTRDSFGNISAKGLSGEGYEGHYFWDTEIFLFPVWLLWDKKRAENLLLYRYGLLDIARARAKEMGNNKGACFSWRTISGIESSGYFPAGSAQYHINFDIAYTFIQWWLSNQDRDFLVAYSMEVLIETARTALEIGSFKKDKFHIHAVTGPDEYTALVSDNYYTNKMAEYNLSWAVKLWDMLEKEPHDDWVRLKGKLGLSQGEIKKMQEAAQKMVFIYDESKGIRAQDGSFLQKAKWPEENKSRPLLLHYHPLNIYRHQIIKQADTVLAQYLLGEETEEIMRKSFYYYEEINTHDSSLSRSISGLMASRLKDEKKAYDYFMDSVYLDIRDLQENTRDGLHMANIGGSLLSVLRGFGGLTIEEDGLHINPFLPRDLGRVRFRFTWRGALLEVLLEGEELDIKKISGPNREIILRGKKINMGEKAVLFDLDGVLTGTSDNHYQAWKKMSKELACDLPEKFRDKLRGIGRAESLDLILDYFGLSYSLEEKNKLTERKNDYYKESISHFSQDNLYPGVIELLEELKKKKVKIALVSASANAKALIRNMDIEKYFDEVVDPRQIKRGKPHPDSFLLAAQKLKLMPRDCLGVEDAKVGIESINAAGMTSLGIGRSDLSQADFVYGTIKEASDFIIKWVEGNYGGN